LITGYLVCEIAEIWID